MRLSLPRHIAVTVVLLAAFGATHAQTRPLPKDSGTRNVEIEEAHDTPPRHMSGEPATSSHARRVPRDAGPAQGREAKIEEAHDTPPETAPSASTRNETIDEAHRTAPTDNPHNPSRARPSSN